MRTVTRFVEQELGATGHYLFAEVDEGAQEVLEVQNLRTTTIERNHVAAERGLQLRVAIELIEHGLGYGVTAVSAGKIFDIDVDTSDPAEAKRIGETVLLSLLALLSWASWAWERRQSAAAQGPITIGLLQALSGPVAAHEAPQVAAARLAVQEINEAGGLLGRRVELKVEDTRADPRVAAVFDWLRANYTLDENPGMGPQGLYYYLHLLSKGLTAAQVRELTTKDGRKVNWRREVALRLMNLQKRDGAWENDNARWWEKETALTTSYALLSLELVWRDL